MKYRIIETLIMLVFGCCLLGYVALWTTHPVLAATKLNLSERERRIIAMLNSQEEP